MGKVALLTGIGGQTGSYLAELLLEKGYEVWGTVKRNSVPENQGNRINHLFDHVHLEYADMTDMPSLVKVVQQSQPDEIYNLAAQSHVRISFDQPIYTCQVVAIGTINLLEVIRLIKPDVKFYQASSSEMFGNNIDSDGFQRESTPMSPVSPYGCAKLFAHNIVKNYRNSYDMYASCGILFNHESSRRGSNFVTAKVVKGAMEIKKGLQTKLGLGNMEATRDWSHAKDAAQAIWMILQHSTPDDFVCSSGVSHSVRELCDYVFTKLDMNYRDYVTTEDRHLRPEELNHLKGDCSKLKRTLDWKPKYTFESMLDEMIEHWDRIL
jgi:GDPmannose 4,6-dehydratase